VIPRYVFDTGALIAAERRKQRAARFLQLVHAGRARIFVPLPVVAEWWRGRTDLREEILAAMLVVGSTDIAKSAGVALAAQKRVDAGLTVDAIVMATAALMDAVLITGDPLDFKALARHFPAVVVLAA
jgi:predicted nucleic acid-binding protein